VPQHRSLTGYSDQAHHGHLQGTSMCLSIAASLATAIKLIMGICKEQACASASQPHWLQRSSSSWAFARNKHVPQHRSLTGYSDQAHHGHLQGISMCLSIAASLATAIKRIMGICKEFQQACASASQPHWPQRSSSSWAHNSNKRLMLRWHTKL
jgi:hypothetical protein